MFEDSTFESTGSIRTRSRGWMLATLLLNASILVALILIPLIDPEALPSRAPGMLLTAPPAPATPPPIRQPVRPEGGSPAMAIIRVPLAPPAGDSIRAALRPDPGETTTLVLMPGPGEEPPGREAFGGGGPVRVIHAGGNGPVGLPSRLVEGLLLRKTAPVYPAIARTAGIQGTVVLQATISKAGTIVNLRVVSGDALLRQAAIDAVARWQYRPCLLNGEPVEVETTVNVVFTLGR